MIWPMRLVDTVSRLEDKGERPSAAGDGSAQPLKTEVTDVRWNPDDALEIRAPKIRRLYVVGAGASCPYGLPTLKTLSRELCPF